MVEFRSIGTIRTRFKERSGMPIQPRFSREVGHIELRPELADGLDGLEGFSHIMLIYHLDRSKGYSLKLVPFLDDTEKGVFATRAPRRPNQIGLSIVELISVEGSIIRVRGVDILDNTPLLDIKPYVPAFDRIDASSGWVKARDVLSDGRFDDG